MVNIQELRNVKAAADELSKAVGKQKEPVIKRIFSETGDASSALSLLFNPMITLGVKEKSLNRDISKAPSAHFDFLCILCLWLAGKNGVNDYDLAAVQEYVAKVREVDHELADFAVKFITKSLKLGVTASTVNKVMGYEVIPEMKCMLANKYFEHENHVTGKDFTLTLKMDGIRCLCVADGQSVEFYSRQGQKIEGMIELEHAIRMLNRSCVFDGELLIDGGLSMESKAAYKATTRTVSKDGEKTGVTYHIFDVLTPLEYEDQQGYFPYSNRRERLEKISREIGRKKLAHLRIVEALYIGNNVKKIQKTLDYVRSNNQEGVMINVNSAPYQFKRTNDLLKVKVMLDCDLEIIGVEEGKGKFKGTLGSLIVNYKGNPVGVGSGLTDEMRKAIWRNPDAYIGRVATIQYFEETKDKDGKLSIRFPVFKELREAGKEVSYE